MSHPAPTSDPGAVHFGRYRLLSRIGSGGMADVFLAKLAQQETVEKYLAVKIMHSHLAHRPRYRAMFLSEARTVSRMSHPNICQFYEVGEERDIPFYAMEYLEGVSVAGYIKHMPPDIGLRDVPMTLGLLIQACEGLHFAHEVRDSGGEPLGIVHRDISPQNLYVTRHGELKLIDFGIAKTRDALAHTKTGVLKGKFRYMAPEQLSRDELSGPPIDRRVDIWALAVVAWEMLVGKPLFGRASEMQTMRAVMESPIPRVDDIRAEIPAPVAEAVAAGLVRDPALRYHTAATFRDALMAAADAAGIILPTRADIAGALPGIFPERWQRLERFLSRLGSDTGRYAELVRASLSSGIPSPAELTSPTTDDRRPVPPPGSTQPTGTVPPPVPHGDGSSGGDTIASPPRDRWLPIALVALAVVALALIGGRLAGFSWTRDAAVAPAADAGDRALEVGERAPGDEPEVAPFDPSAGVVAPSRRGTNDAVPAEAVERDEVDAAEERRASRRGGEGPDRDQDRKSRRRSKRDARGDEVQRERSERRGRREAARKADLDRDEQAAREDVETAPAEAVLDGSLSINAIPYAVVFIDGDAVGETPLIKHSLPAGTHRVRLLGSNGVSKDLTVTVRAGKETRLGRHDLR